MSRDEVRYERQGQAAVLTIDRPERRNAVDAATATALRQGLEDFEADAEARVLVLTGAGGEAFCAGADLKAIDLDVDHPGRPDGLHPPYSLEADDRGDRRLVPGRRPRACPLVRPADRHRRLGLRLLRAPLGGAADRRRHPAAAPDRGNGPGDGDDPHRPPGRGRGGAEDRSRHRDRRAWPAPGAVAGARREARRLPPGDDAEPTAAPRSRVPACRWPPASSWSTASAARC